jgi:hypothetical protein
MFGGIIVVFDNINKMNKSNQSSINNYLASASLFKSSQKNRFVSAYITHKNYF